MGGSHLGNAGIFLITTLFGMYTLAVMLRFLLQIVRADFYNPVSQFIVKVTNPPLRPLRRVIPGVGGIDMAAVVLMLVLKFVELFIVGLLMGYTFNVIGLAAQSLVELLRLTVDVFFYSILIQVILSWVSPGGYNPVVSLLYSLNEPILRPARRLLPPVHGFDLSPVIAMIFLQLVNLVVIASISDLAQSLLRLSG